MAKIEFSIPNRPPRKYRNNSIWNSDVEAPFVKKLRDIALMVREEAGLKKCFSCSVRMELVVYAKNITSVKDAHNYIGDLDGFIAGICESLQPANEQAPIHEIFTKAEESYPTNPILFLDDSQIIEIHAKKLESENTSYTLSIEEIK